MAIHVEEITLPPQHAAVITETVPREAFGAFTARALTQIMRSLVEQGAHAVGPPFGRYEIQDGAFKVSVGVPCQHPIDADGSVRNIELPAGHAVSALHIGPYDEIGEVYDELHVWMDEHGFVPANAPWESYLDAPGTPNPRTKVVWPCAPR
jgi:effector-binding domain-containing protein